MIITRSFVNITHEFLALFVLVFSTRKSYHRPASTRQTFCLCRAIQVRIRYKNNGTFTHLTWQCKFWMDFFAHYQLILALKMSAKFEPDAKNALLNRTCKWYFSARKDSMRSASEDGPILCQCYKTFSPSLLTLRQNKLRLSFILCDNDIVSQSSCKMPKLMPCWEEQHA